MQSMSTKTSANYVHEEERKCKGKSLVTGKKYHDNRKYPAQGDIFSDFVKREYLLKLTDKEGK